MTTIETSTAREQAIKRLKKRHELYNHLTVYAVVNGFLVAIWAVIDVHGFFWPIFPILGWGVAVILHVWDVFRRDPLTEARIQREIEHWQQRR